MKPLSVKILVLLILAILFVACCFNSRINVENMSMMSDSKIQSHGCLVNTPNRLANREVDILQCRESALCEELFPKTYFNTPNEISTLRVSHDQNAWFILKKIWGEQRRGLQICQLHDFFAERNKGARGKYDDCDQIQELITDSLLIHQRVFHIRMYFIVDCDKGIFLYNNGLAIYCEDPFDINDIKPSNIITGSVKSGCQNQTFLKERGLPKTVHEFYAYLERVGVSSTLMQQRLVDLFKRYAKMKSFCESKPKQGNCKRYKHIFGPDILIRSDLRPVILEVNQWPLLATSTKNPEIEWQNPMKRLMFHCFSEQYYPPEMFHKIQ
jgi:hypothetical protein